MKYFLYATAVTVLFILSSCSCKAKAFYNVDLDVIFDPSDSIEMMVE